MQMMGPTRRPEMIVVIVVVVPTVEKVKLSHHYSDIPLEFLSGDTSTT
jgi:hypothetical protein